MNDISLLPARLKVLRQGAGLTQGQLAEKSGISQSQISSIENGDYNVRVQTLALLADALNINMADFFIEFNKEDWCDADCEDVKFYKLATAFYEYEIYKSYYPPKLFDKGISTLLEFIVYLPLVDPLDLYSALQRIGGDFSNNETYISDQLEALISHLPEGPEKDYADHVYSILQQRRDTRSIDLSSYDDEMKDSYIAYNDLLEKKQKFYDDIMNVMPLASELGSRSLKWRISNSDRIKNLKVIE